MRQPNRYEALIERVFFDNYTAGAEEVAFGREQFAAAATDLNIALPKNLGDIIYSFRYRVTMPPSILATARPGRTWVIRSSGKSTYQFVQVVPLEIRPNPLLAETKIPDSTPGVIDMYALGDEQALLAKLRYNRLVDVFTGVACYSLQSHLRTTVPRMGQVETDEVYVGVDKRGVHYVFPVQAKGPGEALGPIQIEQDVLLCIHKFPRLLARPIGAQFIEHNLIAMYEFEAKAQDIRIVSEKHYRLVSPQEVTTEDLEAYKRRLD